MENFVVSARKYRPAVFSHVLSQPHIITTLKNAIKANRLAQAFLFCGPRGVGKTTCARLLAKILNCQQVTADTEPCNACDSCRAIQDQRSMAIHELDAASNNSVEDIRQLVTQVRYPPQGGAYKVYIMDEVHMLSQAAFNAFLKTLEEPPRYAVFILATTERHKILPTIASRCQVFDFQRIQPQAIVEQLEKIAIQEGIVYEKEALHLISHQVEGAMRDALSIFDRMVAFGAGKTLTYAAALANLHVLDRAYYFRLTQALLGGDIPAALLLYDQILRAGFEGHIFIKGLCAHFRNLMVCQDVATVPLLEVTEHFQAMYYEQAKQVGLPFLLRSLQVLQQCDVEYQRSQNQRLQVELALIALANPVGASSLPPAAVPEGPGGAVTQAAEEQRGDLPVVAGGEDLGARLGSQEGGSSLAGVQETLNLQQLTSCLETDVLRAIPPTLLQPLPLTQEAVQEHWVVYRQQLQVAGRKAAYRLMHQAWQLEGDTIVLALVNAVQQDILRGFQEELKAYLCAQLRLSPAQLVIQGVMVPLDRQAKPFTVQEKWQHWLHRYPHLLLLQQQLGLTVLY